MGSSGADGVSIGVGAATGVAVLWDDLLPLPPDGAYLEFALGGGIDAVPGVLGSAYVTRMGAMLDATVDFGPISPADYTVTVTDDGVVVVTLEGLANPMVMFTPWPLGVDAYVNTVQGTLDALWRWDAPQAFSIEDATLPEPVEVTGDGLKFSAASAAQLVMSEATLLAADITEMTIINEGGKRFFNAFGLLHMTEGNAIVNYDWDFGNGTFDLVVSNIGMSGMEGVSIDLGDAEGFTVGISDVTWPIEAFIDLVIIGGVDGVGDQPVGSIRTSLIQDVDLYRVTPDFSPVGVTDYQVRVYQDAVETACFDEVMIPSIEVDTTGGTALEQWHTGARFDDVTAALWIVADWPGPVDGFVLDNDAVFDIWTGDTVVFSGIPSVPVGPLERADVMAADVDSFTIIDEAIGMFDQDFHALGQAHIDAMPGMMDIANIGSSGEDGVSIDLAPSMQLQTQTMGAASAAVEIDPLGPAASTPNGSFVDISAIVDAFAQPDPVNLRTTVTDIGTEVRVSVDFSEAGVTMVDLYVYDANDNVVATLIDLTNPTVRADIWPVRFGCEVLGELNIFRSRVDWPGAQTFTIEADNLPDPVIVAGIAVETGSPAIPADFLRSVSAIELRAAGLPMFNVVSVDVTPVPPSFTFTLPTEGGFLASKSLAVAWEGDGPWWVGMARDTEGVWNAVGWRTDGGDRLEAGPTMIIETLPNQQGTTASIATDIACGTVMYDCIAVGSADSPGGEPQPYEWDFDDNGMVWNAMLLPMGPGVAGQANGIAISTELDIRLAGGWVRAAGGVNKPTVWESISGGAWERMTLPDVAPSKPAEVLNPNITLDGLHGTFGWAINASDERRPVVWEHDGGNWTISELPLLPGGSNGEATSGVAGLADVLAAVLGWSDIPGGDRHAVMWTFDGAMWEVTDLGTVGAYANSMGHAGIRHPDSACSGSFPAVVLGQSYDGQPGTGMASLWHVVTPTSGVYPWDIYELVPDLPVGTTIRAATGVARNPLTGELHLSGWATTGGRGGGSDPHAFTMTLITGCAADSQCDDGDPCTVDTCDTQTRACVSTYESRPYGDVQPVPDPPATFPCSDPEEQARAGDGFLTMLDVMCAFNAMSDGFPHTNCPCADVNPCGGDNFLTMLDVMAIFNTMNDPASAPCPDPCP